MQVAIHHEGKYGAVRYDKHSHELMVTHPNEKVRNTVRHYLSNERQFVVSADADLDKKGNRMLVSMKPIDSEWALELGLIEMFHHTGVHVDWGNKDNFGGTTPDDSDPLQPRFPEDDPNSKADKPILKSILGDGDYEIIN